MGNFFQATLSSNTSLKKLHQILGPHDMTFACGNPSFPSPMKSKYLKATHQKKKKKEKEILNRASLIKVEAFGK